MKHLYVSYAHKDWPLVERFTKELRSTLKTRGIPADLWLNYERLKPGENWTDAIRRALDTSIGVLVFVSAASMQSDWIRIEINPPIGVEATEISSSNLP